MGQLLKKVVLLCQVFFILLEEDFIVVVMFELITQPLWVARDLGISDSLIHNGLARHGQQTGAGAAQAEQATESARLKRLLVQREEEVSILKKAAAYFVRESR